jgi:pyruvate dehydrogenase E2 component (dihydrolipoamide acetyltransferase)
MAIEITVPRLGWSMEEGTFIGWLKADGERIRSGDFLFSLEGDKSAQEVECFDEGILQLSADSPQAGDTVRVGQVLGHLVAADGAPSHPIGEPSSAPTAPIPESPAFVHEQPARSETRGGPHASPRARRRAAEMGVEWATLAGSGRDGRIRERDVLAAAATTIAPLPRATLLEASAGLHPHTPLRSAIARRMTASHQASAPVTLTTTIDASNLVNLRDQFRAAGGSVPTFTELLIKLTAGVLHDHPMLNARWEERGIAVSPEVHIAFAVDTESGLLAPVIRHADRLGLRELGLTLRSLADRARSGQLTDAEMQGATFTLTNLGAYGIDAFTPILNPPQCAILGIGRVRKEAVLAGRDLSSRDAMTLSLTFDHRVTDGGPAARFLQAVGRAVENPAERLIG